ncbi:MAG: deoxyhypusine synthase family protein [Pseudomonadota bacterium]
MRAFRAGAVGSVSDLLHGLAGTAFTGRTLGEAADVLESMLRDEQCTVVLTMSGALTMAGFQPLVGEMIERGWVQCIIATGALVGHGLVQTLGMTHYKANPRVSDREYYALRLNRVHDTLEPEANLDALEGRVSAVFDALARELQGRPIGTTRILERLGRDLGGEGILQAAAQRGVPVFIPAFIDSELGLDLAVHQERARQRGQETLRYDAFEDLRAYRSFSEAAVAKGRLGIFTLGGGVPRNWAQQIGPFADVLYSRLGLQRSPIRFQYGVRICPDPVHYGHLSGCTYSEGVSWGKFVPAEEGGRYAEVLLDATVGWPLLVRAMMDRGL